MDELQFTSYERRPDNPTVVGTTNTGARIGFETEDQYIGSGGLRDQSNVTINPNLDLSGITAYSQYKAPTTPVKLDIPQAIPSSILANTKTRADIDSLLAENRKLQEQYLGALKPTAEEQAANEKLLAIQQGARRDLQLAEGRLAPTFAIQGEQQTVLRNAAIAEQAAAENLRAQTSKRQVTLDSLQAAIQFGQGNLEQQLGIDQYFRSIDKDQKAEARQTVADIVSFSKGKSFAELDEQAKQAIIEATANSPITLDMVKTALGAENRALAQERGVTAQFFTKGGNTAYRTDTGEAVDLQTYKQLTGQAGVPDAQVNFGLIQALPQSTQVQSLDLQKQKAAAELKGTESEVDSYTDTNGNRISVLLNNATGKMRSISTGKAENDDVTDPIVVSQFADAVVSGSLTLNGVPQSVRAQVSALVNDMSKSKYSSEFEARVDYDREIEELRNAITNGEQVSGRPSEIIRTLAQDYGKHISSQEITNTLYNLLGITPPKASAAGKGGFIGPTQKLGSNYTSSIGTITGLDGSSAWRHGLDIDLKKGDPVPSPVNGKIVFVGPNKGFGNQVKIREANGNEVWLSHLDAAKVKVGQTVTRGTVVGLGGNTGTVIKGKGGDGSHLDLTIKTPNGYMAARKVKDYVDNYRV